MRMKKLTQDDRTAIVRRSQAGETQEALAKAYKVAQSTIARVLAVSRRNSTSVEDPNPSLAAEHVQARFWKRHERFYEVLSSRNKVLRKSRQEINVDIKRYDTRAKDAPTRKLSDAFKARADTYRLELAALDDLTDFDDELTELISELYTLSQVLCRGRKVGLGTKLARKGSEGEEL